MRSTRSVGAEYFAETTRSCVPGIYSAAMNTPGLAGSGVAIASSFAASSAWTSSLAAAADFESSADAGIETPAAHNMKATRRIAGRPIQDMVDLTCEEMVSTL